MYIPLTGDFQSRQKKQKSISYFCGETKNNTSCKASATNLDLDNSCLNPDLYVTSDSEAESQVSCFPEPQDKDYLPPACEEAMEVMDDTSDTEDEDELESHQQHTTVSATKYIVYKDELLKLFQHCKKCGSHTEQTTTEKGSMLRIEQVCPQCRHSLKWDSQPMTRDLPDGNLLMSAAILYSGSLSSKVLRFLQHMGVASISEGTFFDHQRLFLYPCVEAEWQNWQQEYVTLAKDSGQLTLGGDGRADSPGHSAKYGTYTLMDLDLMQVVDVRTVQSNEVGNSCRMEKEGLQRALDFICRESGLTVREIVTDRHPMIIKFLREEMKGTKHSIDVWHVGKGMKKRMIKLAKEKDCEELLPWIKSIINHLYWVAASMMQTDN